MGRREDPPDNRELDLEPDAKEIEAYEEIERVINEAGPGSAYRVHVFKVRPDQSGHDRIRSFPISQLDIDALPVKFGGGQYMLQLVNDKGQYVKRLRVSFPVSVYPDPPPQPAEPAPTAPSVTDLAARQLEAMQTELREERSRHMHFMEIIVTALAGGKQQGTLADQLAVFREMRSMTGEAAPAPPTQLLFDAIKGGLELARGRSPGDEESDDRGEAPNLMKLLDRLAESMLNRAPAAGRPATMRPGAQGPGGRPGTPEQRTNAGGDPNGAGRPALPPHLTPYAWLLRYMPILKGWAADGTPADRVAGAMYELVPDQHMPALESFVRMPHQERNAILVGLDSTLGPYQAWLTEIAQAIVSRMEGDDVGDSTLIDIGDGSGESDRGSDKDPAGAG